MGRAVLAVDGPVSKEFEDIILAACLEDQRHDRQCESNRSEYLMKMVESTNLGERLLQSLFSSLKEDLSERDMNHRLWMIGKFAERSNREAMDFLQALALEMSLQAVDVLASIGHIEWVVQHVLPSLSLEDKWRARTWLDDNPELTGESREPLVIAQKTFDVHCGVQSAEAKDQKLPTFEEAIESIQINNLLSPMPRQISSSLTDEQINEVAELWLKERDPRRGRSYKRLFENLPFPLPVRRIIELVQDGDPPVAFEQIVAQCEHPLVREFAYGLISRAEPDYRGYLCLRSSFADEDLPWMVESLGHFSNQSEDTKHRLGMDLKEIAKDMTPAESEPFLVWVYEHTPCSMCRGFAAQMMIKAGTLPEFYREEMKNDADSLARELAAKMP